MTEQSSEHDLFGLLRQIRYDATAIQAKVTDALRMAAAAGLTVEPPAYPCPRCGGAFRGERELAFHVANVHAGPPVPLSPAEVAG